VWDPLAFPAFVEPLYKRPLLGKTGSGTAHSPPIHLVKRAIHVLAVNNLPDFIYHLGFHERKLGLASEYLRR